MLIAYLFIIEENWSNLNVVQKETSSTNYGIFKQWNAISRYNEWLRTIVINMDKNHNVEWTRKARQEIYIGFYLMFFKKKDHSL